MNKWAYILGWKKYTGEWDILKILLDLGVLCILSILVTTVSLG